MPLPVSASLFKALAAGFLAAAFQFPAVAQTPIPPAEATGAIATQALPLQASPGQTAPTQAVPAQPAPTQEVPSWFADGRPINDAWAVVQVLADAESHGLEPKDYKVQSLVATLETARQSGLPPEAVTQADAQLTQALERYLTDLHHGRISPQVLKHRFKAPPTQKFDARQFILQGRQSGNLAPQLAALQPQVPMYAAVRKAMHAYRAMGDHTAWQTPLPALPGRSLKPEQEWEGLPLLAQRLAALGDLPPQSVATQAYDDYLVEGVKRFQARHGLETDGVLGPATLTQLNVSPAQRAQQMALTLERLRWTPLLYGPRMIVVNVPEFVLRAYELQGSQVQLNLEMRVVVGRALDTRTPMFLEDMRFIEFSPYWNVPISIARGETLPRLRRDPGYFDQQGFEFVRRDGSVATTLSNEGIEAVQKGEWRIRQRPGPRNALGDIKFIFPNDQNIYLHHTPAPQLFARGRRDFSHGCIRIEHPVDLARFVLKNKPEWTTERIEEAMQRGTSRTLRLDEPIPVLITYSTVVVKDGGTVYFFPDIYQQDTQLQQALRSARPSGL